MSLRWEIWVDTGGTFTDCLAKDPQGRLSRLKVLSSSRLRGQVQHIIDPTTWQISHSWPVDQPIFSGYTVQIPGVPTTINATVRDLDPLTGMLYLDRALPVQPNSDFELTAQEEAPVLAARVATQTPLYQNLPPIRMRLGSTRGTNALLERKGAPMGLLITQGFRDLPYIGTQARPELFQLDIPEPDLLYQHVWEVPERMSATGEVIQSLTNAAIAALVQQVRNAGVSSVAIALLHAYRNPVHEKELRNALRAAGIDYLSVSHELSPTIQLLPRTRTALVNAYLAPVIDEYLRRIAKVLGVATGHGELFVMSSAGGLVSHHAYRPKDSLLSGPAGGVVGAATIAHRLGIDRLLTLDMGGTSTDTARYAGNYDYQFSTRIDGIDLQSPALAIETVAAGGGSICSFDGQKLTVGPESAGADPGPACYGAGGPLTITDVDLLLGKLRPDRMGIPIHPDLARQALENLRKEVIDKTGTHLTAEDVLQGLDQIANEKMADAIRRISVARGFDPADHALLAFGGAGGMHAAQVAELLDISTLILPYDSGLLSAYGIGHARVERLAEQQVLLPLDQAIHHLDQWIAQIQDKAQQQLIAEGFSPQLVQVRQVLLFLRMQGQHTPLTLTYTGPDMDLAASFRQKYTDLFGYFPEDRPIELESIRCIAATRGRLPDAAALNEQRPISPHFSGQPGGEYPHYIWKDLLEGDTFTGPALILSDHATAFLPKGWSASCRADGNLLARHVERQKETQELVQEAIALELFTNRFTAIAKEMGAQLQRTALSVNVKERLDFSCALLDPNAHLLVNAPHIPVHLGSLGLCARLILDHSPLEPGDVLITNHPKYGGSHLPDITLLSGVFTDHGECIGYVINRAHHAEVGGKRPGSMPPDATCLAEEGVALTPTYLVRHGEVQWEMLAQKFQSGLWPSRAPQENLADCHAALAALRLGQQALQQLVAEHDLDQIHHYMGRLQDLAAQTLEKALSPWRGRFFEAEEYLDDGHRICVRIDFRQSPYTFDFSGTSPPHPYNLNANLSIVYSAVLYVLRLICNEPIPLNEGLMRQIQLEVPTSLLHPDFSDDPRACPAVVGGNTEVSQRLVDTLLKALGLSACSQGTMNNLLFGDDTFGYYETIGGGVGAGPGFSGRSAVHQHMTNTRLTDPEELEFRYPVRVQQFGIRPNSGGAGTWCGGDGIVREISFLRPVDFTLLSQHRSIAPYGLEGGSPGQPGQQWLLRPNGDRIPLSGIDHCALQPGDRIRLETPGGGGYGPPPNTKKVD